MSECRTAERLVVISTSAYPCLVIFMLTALFVIFGGTLAQCQENDDEPADKARPNHFDRAIVVEPALELTFERWVFGSYSSAAKVHARLDAELARQVEQLTESCGLTDSQRTKLRKAGQADIKRLFDSFRTALDRIRDFPPPDDPKQAELQTIEAAELAMRLQTGFGVPTFGEGSLFKKTLDTTLDSEQVARREADDFARTIKDHAASVSWSLMILDQSLGLTNDQRARLEKLILAECPPPRRMPRRFAFFAILYQTAQISEEKLRAIVDDEQWAYLRNQLARAKSMKSTLELQGFEPNDDSPQPSGTRKSSAGAIRPKPVHSNGRTSDTIHKD